MSRFIARLRPARSRRTLSETDDFIVDNNRINIARPNVFKRDPVNLIRLFYLAQKHNLAFHPEAMRAATRSLKLIDKDVREDKEANRLFLEILTSKNDAETVLRRMNEAGVLGDFVRAFGRIVAMMQFNMYHHYTVDEHLIRCIGVLDEIERGDNPAVALASELMRTIQPQHRTVLYVALFLHDIAKGRIEDHSIAGARIARRLCPRLGFNAADTELVAWLVEVHLVMSTVAQSRDLSDRKTIENFAAVVQSLERMKLLDHPHHRRHPRGRARACGTAGRRSSCARSITRPSRCSPAASPRSTAPSASPRRRRNSAPSLPTGRRPSATPISAATIRPIGSRSICRTSSRMRASCARPKQAGKRLATSVGFDAARGVTELTVFAPDHPWLLSIIAGACALAGANIVDAQIYTTTDGLALDTISVSREFERDEDEARRAARIGDLIEKALRGEIKLPDVVAKRAPPKGRLKAFAIEPEVTINNQWSARYTVVEVTGLDRPGLLYELTTTLSKLNLNIASAHVATFGERVVDVFYVTDLPGAQIATPTRQAAIKRPLLALFTQPAGERKAGEGERGGVTTASRLRYSPLPR